MKYLPSSVTASHTNFPRFLSSQTGISIQNEKFQNAKLKTKQSKPETKHNKAKPKDQKEKKET